MTYVDQGSIGKRFGDEAVAALLGTLASPTSPLLEDFFDVLMRRCTTLKQDQQLAKWICC
jgi:hypothetical protein